MADDKDPEDKTEEASERRIEQAFERGDVPRSTDLSGFLVISAGFATLILLLRSQADGQVRIFGQMLKAAGESRIDGRLAGEVLGHVASVVAAPFLAAILAAIGAGMVLHKLNFSLEPLAPKGQRISPFSGFKRLLGKENLVNFLRALIKLAAVVGVIVTVIASARDDLTQLSRLDTRMIAFRVAAITTKAIIAIALLYGAIAMADAVYQVFAWKKRLRMSVQEVKDEHKTTDGNPEIRARLRSLRQQRSRHRMMAAVPKATVIIVNPTHFAVALRYDKQMAAPVCVAKGVDETALRIRAMAGEHRVPLISNPPLARLLFATVEIDEPIPAEHYKAVAEIIGFVLRARKHPANGRG